MKVAMITDGIWPYVLGGMQKHSFYLCKYLAKNKIHIDLVHFNASTYDISKLEFFSSEEKKYINSIIVDFPKSSKLPGHYIRNSYEHSRLIFEKIKGNLSTYDFIYTKGFTGWYLIEQKKAGKINCAKIGVKFHGYEMFQKSPDTKTKLQHILLLRKPVKWISRHADVVFSYGGKITDIIRSIGVDASKIAVIPSGVEIQTIIDNIRPTGDQISFLFLGRYERRKGIEELNKALQSLSGNNFQFNFIGPIPDDKKIAGKNIKYHGEIRDKNQLMGLMRSCDVLVCPSWSEGMPNVILEAMANGVAVLATDVGATNVLVNDKTGWLINSSDPETIKTTLEKILKTPPSEIDSKKVSSLTIMKERFNWEKLIEELRRIID
ncbi:MAG: glycosyltransferase family 4 protein [Bacteroidetes bacterium]|jgi:glycosyltransferase involved in cell wall biosynthesis|nr:glycosyltransferase family 4 protein [Bacteroidota bacterium]